MRPIITTVTRFAVLDCMLENTYADYPHQLEYLHGMLRDAALYHHDEVVAQRVLEDDSYFRIFKSVVSFIFHRLLYH